jgi:O-antigen/teichoic acid export membrane protein
VGSLSGVLLARLDQAIMTPLAGVYQLGLYAAAVSVTDTALILNSAVRDVTFATHVADRDDERLCASARISAAVSLVFCGLIAAAAPLGLPLLFGSGFRPAVPVALWLLAAIALATPGSIAGAALSARGRPELRSAGLVIACLVNVVALVLLLPHYGAIGAAIATFIGNVIASQLNIACLSRLTGIAGRRFYGLRRSDVVTMRSKVREGRSALLRFTGHPVVAR